MRRFLKIRHNTNNTIIQKLPASFGFIQQGTLRHSLSRCPRVWYGTETWQKWRGQSLAPLSPWLKVVQILPGGFPKLHDSMIFLAPNQNKPKGWPCRGWIGVTESLMPKYQKWSRFMAVRDPKKGVFFPQRLEMVQETGSKTWRFELLRQWISYLTSTCSETTHLISLTNI